MGQEVISKGKAKDCFRQGHLPLSEGKEGLAVLSRKVPHLPLGI